MCPLPSDQVTYAIHSPSGDHVGLKAWSAVAPAKSRRGADLARRGRLRRALGQIQHVEIGQHRHHDAAAVGRLAGILDQPRAHGAFRHPVGELQRRADRERDLRAERHGRLGARLDVDPLEASVAGQHDLAAVGCERVAGQRVAARAAAALLLVAGHRPLQEAVGAGLEVPDAQPGLRLGPRGVDHQLAIRRDQRPEPAPLRLCDDVRVTRPHVEPRDLPA